MSEVFITRKGGGSKTSAPELLITEVGGSWVEFEVTNTEQVQSAQIFLLANYDPNSEEAFDVLAVQNGKVITVAAGATVTELLQGLDSATTHTISAQAAVIKKLPSSIVTTDPTDLLQTGIPTPTIASLNVQDTFFNYSLLNNESTIPVDFKIAITTSTAVPTNYPISQTNVAPNTTVNLSATGLNPLTTYYAHVRAVDGVVESNNVFVSFSTLAVLYAFTSWTFTNAGATGRTGPNITQVRSAYSSQSWAQNNDYLSMTTQGIQRWTVPQSGTYRIEPFGAQGANAGTGGGSGVGGLGARMRGDFSLNRGEVIRIVVGQVGGLSAGLSGGGGGGSYVLRNTTFNTSDILVIAGGGGGARSSGNGGVGSATQSATPGGTYPVPTIGQGGNSSGFNGGAGGAGFNSNGQDGQGGANSGGQSPANNFLGGVAGTCASSGAGVNDVGGFGGGGGGEWCSQGAGGGGGGYTGGNGSNLDPAGGGAGSFNSGSNQSNSAGARSGQGQVIITRL